MQLEFGLQVHFALWPLITGKDQQDRLDNLKRMSNFKNYLETRGAVLVSHADFLPYYALPHVPEPENHPSFQHLLDPQCMAAQRSQLEAFLKALPDRGQRPQLYRLLATDASRAWSSRSPEARLDPAALLTGQETLDSFIGKSPVNMSYESHPSPMPAPSRVTSTSAQDLLSSRADGNGSPVPCVKQDEATVESAPASPTPTARSSGKSVPRDGSECLEMENGSAVAATTAPSIKHEGAAAGEHGCTADEALEPGSTSSTQQPAAAAAYLHAHQPDPLATNSDEHHQPEEAEQGVSQGHERTTPVSTAAKTQQNGVEVDAQQDALEAGSSPEVPARDRYSARASAPQQCEDVRLSEVQVSSRLTRDQGSCEGPFAEHSAVYPRQQHDGALTRRSITRTAQEQAQLPPVAWDRVKADLASSDVGLRAALLQVRFSGQRSCQAVEFTINAWWCITSWPVEL